MPGALPRVIRLLLHCYAADGAPAQHVYLREAWRCAATWRGPSDGIEFNRRLEAIPVYPVADSYEYEGELVKLASNETPWGPRPRSSGPSRASSRR